MFGTAFGAPAILRPRNTCTAPFRKQENLPRLKMNWKKIIPIEISV
jgi:hypothetical protein